LATIGAYVINMDGARERWLLMEGQLEALGMPYERFAAVDGKKLGGTHPDFSPLSYMLMHGRRFIPGEVGCYLSHVGALKAFLASGHDHALILEDDVVIDPRTPELIEAAIATGTWDILRLSTVNSGAKHAYKALSADHDLAIALTREKGAGAYVVTRRSAEWLTGMLPIRMAWDIAFDIEYLYGLRASFIVPVPCDQNTGMETQIQNRIREYKLPSWRYVTVFPVRAFLETSRLITRLTRLVSLRLRFSRRPDQGSPVTP
jgi:glycosyl transferase family 25